MGNILRPFRKISAIPLIMLFVIISLGLSSISMADESVTIGLIPEMNVFKQKKRFQPLADYLSDKVGIEVRLTMLSRYGNILQNFKNQKMDAAFLGSFTGALAITQLKVEPLARPINMDGTSTYFGHIFVRKDSGIKTVADMKGKTLALVERATTAGYVFPLAYFKRNGIADMKKYFKEKVFTGSHDAAIEAVLTGQAEVGAAKNTVYERVKAGNSRIEKEMEILVSSPRVPSNGLCVKHDMNPLLKMKLKKALLQLHDDPVGAQVLSKLGALRFVETNKKDYQPVIDLAAEAGLNLSDYQYYNP